MHDTPFQHSLYPMTWLFFRENSCFGHALTDFIEINSASNKANFIKFYTWFIVVKIRFICGQSFLLRATLTRFVYEDGWYYAACPTCFKQMRLLCLMPLMLEQMRRKPQMAAHLIQKQMNCSSTQERHQQQMNQLMTHLKKRGRVIGAKYKYRIFW
ncbi:uncharacterized protein LOC133731441 [Rosa rugosa]|uniref:uncharacterized protein LOC133731441 n=1 Tax=Rosa rugosa TaxID=74645 RepID=UPI002B40A92D|nr:uncharacterized protein LOC133731441 [Rosa rugosa]